MTLPSVANVLCKFSYLIVHMGAWVSAKKIYIQEFFVQAHIPTPKTHLFQTHSIFRTFVHIKRLSTTQFLFVRRFRILTKYSKMFPFLDLPFEIRDLIYDNIFDSPKYTTIRPIIRVVNPASVNILLASKQIYSEAIQFFYSHRATETRREDLLCRINYRPMFRKFHKLRPVEIVVVFRKRETQGDNDKKRTLEKQFKSFVGHLTQLPYPDLTLVVVFLGNTPHCDIAVYMETLRQLAEFKAVTVVVDKAPWPPRCVRGEPSLTEAPYQKPRKQVLAFLEPTFGLGEFHEDKHPEEAFRVKFEPRKNAAITAIEEESALKETCEGMKEMQLES